MNKRLGSCSPQPVWIRCPACAAMADVAQSGTCSCGATLPETPPILHDWNLERKQQFLGSAYEALPRAARS